MTNAEIYLEIAKWAGLMALILIGFIVLLALVNRD